MILVLLNAATGYVLNKPYIISIYNEPNLRISSDDKVVRLKAADDNYVGYKTEIIGKIVLDSQKLKILYEGHPLCTYPDINEVATCNTFDEANNNSVWDIVTTEHGILMQEGDRCLTKSEYDEFYKGYVLRMQVCTNDEKQFWHLEDYSFTDEELSDAENRSKLNKRRIKYLQDHKGDKLIGNSDSPHS